jgi:hypothetical protein
VTLHRSDLGLRDEVVEAGLEITGARVRGCHLRSVLTTTENNLDTER